MRPILAAALFLAPVAPASAAVLTDFGLLTAGDVTLSSQTVAGRALVGGNFTANSSTLGSGLGTAANGSAVLQVTGNFKYDNSTIPNGGVVYGGTNGSDFNQYYSNQVKTPNGSVAKGSVTGVPTAFAAAVQGAKQAAGLAATGTFREVNNDSIGRLEGVKAGVNVFNLTGADLASITTLRLFGTSDAQSSLIVNVGAAQSYVNFLAVDLAGLFSTDRVLFNFTDATSLSLGGWNLPGTLLATKATVTQNGGSISGAVVADRFVGAGGGFIGGRGFAALPDPAPSAGAVPEPATWAMMILGVGLIGGALRHRTRTRPALA